MDDRRPDEELVDQIRAAYAGSADGWASGPARLYRQLAVALVGRAPRPLTGRRVLDLGAGTGVVSDALAETGAHAVGLDLAVEMLAYRSAHRPPGVAGDAQALPFGDGTFDAVVAAFCLNHVPDLRAALSECRRVIRPGGLVLASSFPTGAEHPAKAAVEAVLTEYGYRRPDWYATFKARIAEPTGNTDVFAGTATAAGLTDVRVEQLEIEAGLDDPHLAVEWRLNMPHTLGFVTTLDPPTRAELRQRAAAALPHDLTSAIPTLVLHATVG